MNTAEIRGRARELQVETKTHCGYKCLVMSIEPNRQHPPYNAVCSSLHPNPVPTQTQPNQYTHIWGAKYCDSIWHSDLHQLPCIDAETDKTATLYLTAFLDDASRHVMHHEILTDNKAHSTGKALQATIQMSGRHCLIPSDNVGGSSLGKFGEMMAFNCIQPWHTKPCAPR
jgi:hypothetical protein